MLKAMAIEDLTGTPRQLGKFVSLTIAIVMMAEGVACAIYARPWWLTVAASMVSAWSALVFSDILKQECREMLTEAQRTSDQTSEPRHENTSSRA